MTGLDYIMHGTAMLSGSYTSPRVMLLDEASMVPDETWDYSYEAMDTTMGALWEASGTITILGNDSITITAGTFDALVIENDYTVVDSSGMAMFDRQVVATMYFVERLGMVYTEELDTTGSLVEIRELNTTTGFYP